MIIDTAESSQMLRSLFETMDTGVAIYSSTDGERFVFSAMNRAGEEMSAVTFREIAGREVREVFPGVVAMGLYDVLRRVWSSGTAETLPVTLYDDLRISGFYENHVCRLSATEVAAVYSDVTTQKTAEDKLRKSESRFRNLFETMQEGFALHEVVFDDAGKPVDYRYLEINPAFERLTGLRREAVVGRTVREVLPQIEELWIETFCRVAVTGEPAELENHVQELDRYYRARAYSPRQGRFVVVFEEITDRKRAEAERTRLEQQLLHAQKLESLGVLAGGIAHDFNNILMAIIGNADLALMRLNRESPAVENLQRIEKAAVQAADLAKQMLAYSGKGKFVIENIDLNRLLEEMLHMLEVSISKKAVLRLNQHQALPSVEADATQMRQIVMNLVINASEAIGDKSGVIAITTGCMDCDKAYLKDVWLDENITEGLYVYLEIADSGCGMDRDTLARIFDPFFTTKFTGRGLGMAAVLGIVRGHKGAIKVYSEPGKGTTFKILLPASDRPAELFDSGPNPVDWRGAGKVLLVDDEETIRGVGAEMLKELGFETITANDGLEALEALRQNPDIDFVVLDLTMPHMDGEQCFRELKKLKPDVRVIMSSGYNEQEVTQKFVGKGLAGFIQKPYTFSVLRDAVMAVLQT